VTKRSPILGYNHNVRYRGLIFHVQTEDSGVLSPHLFTHLFHEGVIVSTRKLVYDAGAAEDAIKALMQAQHKAVMKDLKNGAFDDKIDQYLGGVEGLEPPKGSTPVPRATTPEVTPTIRQERFETEVDPSPVVARVQSDEALTKPTVIEVSSDPSDLSEPIELPRKSEPAVDVGELAKPRTRTGNLGSKASTVRFNPPPDLPPPPPEGLDAPTIDEGAIAAARAAQATVSRTVTPAPGLGVKFRTATPPPARAATPPPVSQKRSPDSSAEITLSLDDGDSRPGERSDGVPRQRNRPPSHGAATLPPAKKPTRPAISPPSAMSRASSDEISEPGERAERPGQYSVKRSAEAPMREKTGRIGVQTPPAQPVARPPASPDRPGSGRHVAPTPVAGSAIPQPVGLEPDDPRGARSPHVTAPISSRPNAAPSSNVVMSRPSVIVGAPSKTPQAAQAPRVRKAREDEGRGFGQGLISEKSLDEVILAYLSEDADDK
jgi:hypothetical protein